MYSFVPSAPEERTCTLYIIIMIHDPFAIFEDFLCRPLCVWLSLCCLQCRMSWYCILSVVSSVVCRNVICLFYVARYAKKYQGLGTIRLYH